MNHNLDDDDFQFRPLTEGLGFQNKKAAKTNERLNEPKFTGFQASAAATSSAKKAAIPASSPMNMQSDLEIAESELTSPLPRKGYATPTFKKQTPEAPTANTVDEILKTLNEKRRYDFTDKKRARISEQPMAEVLFQNSTWEFAASMLDLMLVTAGTLLCLIVLLMLTKVDLYANLMRPDSAGMVYLSLLALVASVSWIYLVVHRVFLGFTPGEWVFDQRLGRPEEHTHAIYAVKAVARATLVIATGFIFFPILSVLFKKDILGSLLNLELVRKV